MDFATVTSVPAASSLRRILSFASPIAITLRPAVSTLLFSSTFVRCISVSKVTDFTVEDTVVVTAPLVRSATTLTPTLMSALLSPSSEKVVAFSKRRPDAEPNCAPLTAYNSLTGFGPMTASSVLISTPPPSFATGVVKSIGCAGTSPR